MREQLYRVLRMDTNGKFFMSAHTEKRPIPLEKWQGLEWSFRDNMVALLITEEHYQRWWRDYLGL